MICIPCLRLTSEGILMSVQIAEGYEIEQAQSARLRLVHSANAIVISELAEDEILRQKTELQIRSIGCVALNSEVVDEPVSNDSLLSAIKRAEKGDKEAVAMVAVNVGSDFSERVLKTGEVSKYYLRKRKDGELIQHGQLYSDIYANTLRLTNQGSKMRPRAEAETRNADRITFLDSQGKLRDNFMVVFSLAPDDMTDEELKNAGFFAETKTMAIQATTSERDSVSIESAFLAGRAEPNAQRHDVQTIVKLAAVLGIDYHGMTAAEILDRPLLIPKSLMSNGVIDLVKLFDDCAGGTFFGEAKPQQDYLAYRAFCDERRKSFSSDVQAVTRQLIQEAVSFSTQLQAIERLAVLSERQMVQRAVKDKTIDANVFGDVAASYIEQARFYHKQGNEQLANQAEANAIRTADSSSCPSGVSRQSEIDSTAFNQTDSTESKAGEDKYGSLTFKCPKGHTNRRPRNKLISHCTTCGVSVKC